MNEGAFALLDCLGFKGVWNRGITPDNIIKFMGETKAYAENLPERHAVTELLGTSVNISTAFLSDSIAISACPKSSLPLPDWAKGYLVFLTVYMCLKLMKRFIEPEAPVPLTFRGCITYGPHLVQDAFFLGPAVDEAASFSHVTQGAFVWLTPPTQRYYSLYMNEFPHMLMQNLSSLIPKDLMQKAETILNTFSTMATITEQITNIKAKWNSIPQEKTPDAALLFIEHLLLNFRKDFVLADYPIQLKSGGILHASVLTVC